jgi:hypothetical protein
MLFFPFLLYVCGWIADKRAGIFVQSTLASKKVGADWGTMLEVYLVQREAIQSGLYHLKFEGHLIFPIHYASVRTKLSNLTTRWLIWCAKNTKICFWVRELVDNFLSEDWTWLKVLTILICDLIPIAANIPTVHILGCLEQINCIQYYWRLTVHISMEERFLPMHKFFFLSAKVATLHHQDLSRRELPEGLR